MNLKEMKNDTARKNAIRYNLANLIYNACVAEFGEVNVRLLKSKITVMSYDGKGEIDIAANSVVVNVGDVEDSDGATVDAIAVINTTVKAWETKTNKSGRTTYAINMDDIDMAIETAETALKEKEEQKKNK